MSDHPSHSGSDRNGPRPYAGEGSDFPAPPPWATQQSAQPVHYNQGGGPNIDDKLFGGGVSREPYVPPQDPFATQIFADGFGVHDSQPPHTPSSANPLRGFGTENPSGLPPAQDRWPGDVPAQGFPQQPNMAASHYYPPSSGSSFGPGHQLRPELPASSRDLSTSALLRPHKAPPSSGWRKLVHTLSFGTINLGEGAKKTQENDLLAQVQQPLQGCYKIALLSLKGGVGKTTVTATLGATFASIRGDRVIAIDANPDRGTLSQKVPLETPATVRHLLRDANSVQRYSDVRSYTSQGPSRLEVLASESDPAVSEAFSAEDYSRTLDLLERFYSVVLTDCGTGLMHSAMSSVLEQADTLVVISSGSVDGARSASATLDWLDAHGHRELVRRSVAVINAVRPRSGKVDMQKVVDHFSRRCRAVRLVPFDPHLEEGAEISLDRLKPGTRRALLELGAVVAQGFTTTQRQQSNFRG